MLYFVLSFLPIITLLICLLVIKLSAKRASLAAFLVAAAEFILWIKPGTAGMVITLEKGLAMSLFVGLIAFSAMLLYNLVDISGGFNVINRYLSGVFSDRFVMFLTISWVFSAFLQGIAGYGLPAVISTTILIKAGFPAGKAAAASLLGHSWAISFGSMGSSIYAIDLVTDTPLHQILVSMAGYGSICMICCGIGISFIYGGYRNILSGLRYVLPAGAVMSLSLMIMARFEMVSVIGFVTGLFGTAAMMMTYKITARARTGKFPERKALFSSIFPYILVILFSLGFFLADPGVKLTFSFPGYETMTGQMVEPEKDYVVFNIFKYPFTIILLTTAICVICYLRTGRLKSRDIKTIGKVTYKKIISTEVTLVFLLCTASIMMDGGMTEILSTTIVRWTGSGYSFMAALIGTLGTFITGTNTNSNILFGSLQETAALSLSLSPALMCAVQSIAASVGGTIGPTNTALVAAVAGKSGKETEIYSYTIPVTLAVTLLLGAVNAVFI
ncbi:MAG TPA: L-lactate permease [Candidatus Fimisoma avicola]|uniref:L-lactate permease n=1 Tax=Candidatus Fimisoma avicola TaxID=2840826 RepID=A0A9D1L9B3_9FIRM|nr:L-lactate permease [Candidatus Fimisoma avicola]